MEMATGDDMGMVWLGDELLPTDTNDMMLDAQTESPFFADSPQAIDDIQDKDPLGMESFMMLDEYDSYDVKPKFMSSTATQTASQPSKKIKPIRHPGLILKTPIAYQRDSDLSVIPIKPEGMAVCEKCGAIGVKHAFYTRERKFCSLACARGYSDLEPVHHSLPKLEPINNHFYQATKETKETMCEEELHSNSSESLLHPLPLDEPPVVVKRNRAELANTYEWIAQLSEPGFIATPVSCFNHAPLSDCWENIIVGMKVEVENTDCENFSEAFPDSFWVATVLKIAGYKTLLRYEGFGQDSSKDFWVNLCSSTVHPVGWCATRGKPLIPPKTIQNKYSDWKEFLVKRLTGARTLPSNFYSKVHDSMKSRFRCGLNLEVVDKNRISQVKVATVQKIVGKRLHVRYHNAIPEDNGFWCHEDSPLIHPVGWATQVGHNIVASEEYLERCSLHVYDKDDATPELFAQSKPLNFPPGVEFKKGMKLEAIDPLNLSAICVATIMKVLSDGYIMIRIDGYDSDETGSDWFCYHASSPCVFPAGFCELNSIPLTPPKGYEVDFEWNKYLQETSAITAPITLFNRDIPPHGFRVGMRLEAADLMDPRLVCVGTVSRVIGRLLKIHFDGWEEEYDQWLDCESPDMYPVGWCHLVGHKLEGPRSAGGLRRQERTNIGKCVSMAPAKKIKKKPRRRHKKGKVAGVGILLKKKGVGVGSVKVADRILRDPPQATKLSVEFHGGESLPEGNGVPSREPEMGQEPAGPDQSLPVPSEPNQPPPPPSLPRERTATSYINSTNTTGKFIPRLIDATGSSETGEIVPLAWNVFDVAQFLRVNDCAAYCDSFSRRKIDGKTLLTLSKDQIIDLTGMKVGPSLKIYDLIQQLKIKVNPAQERLKANLKKILS